MESHFQALVSRKMKLQRVGLCIYSSGVLLIDSSILQERRRANIDEIGLSIPMGPLVPLFPPQPILPANPQVLNALYGIHTTPFETSFLSRLQGTGSAPLGTIAADWESITPWMSLLDDIREHYNISQ